MVRDGWSATRQIKASSATGHIPIIVCTGHASDRSAERAREAGCDVFLMKPCPPDDLLAAVTQLLGRSSSA